jgi:hypothetical protein
LAHDHFSAAAIDAPFSIPWWFFGHDFADHLGFMSVVNDLSLTEKQLVCHPLMHGVWKGGLRSMVDGYSSCYAKYRSGQVEYAEMGSG